MAQKSQTPFDKMMVTQARLHMYVQHGDVALQGQAPQEFAAEVKECMDHLMTFRNIINGMVSFDEVPERAALFYIPDEMIQEVAGV